MDSIFKEAKDKTAILVLAFYSTPNITGLLLLLVGLLAHITFMMLGWHDLTLNGLSAIMALVLLYLIGASVGWYLQPDRVVFEKNKAITTEQVARQLDDIVAQCGDRLPREAVEQLIEIRRTSNAIMPKLEKSNLANEDIFILTRAVFDYLPTTIEGYLNLTPLYANTYPIHQGKTAKNLLLEQLQTLNKALSDIAYNVFENDAQALLANQRFLLEKFGSAGDNSNNLTLD